MTRDEAITILIEQGASPEKANATLDYIAEHPQLWKSFQRFCLDHAQRGWKQLGSKFVFEHIRYKEANGDYTKYKDYKLCNNYTPYFARLFMDKYPQFGDFFSTKDVN